MEISATVIVLALSLILFFRRKNILEFLKFRLKIAKLPKIFEKAYPLVGHTYLLVGDATYFFHYITGMSKEFMETTKEKFMVIWLGPSPLLIVLHPDAAEVILKTSKHITKSFVYRFLHPWLGTGLLTSKGEKWKQRRRLITPSFHFNILQDFLQVMNEQSRIMISKIDEQKKSGRNIDVAKTVTMCALDIICETAMGQSVNAQSDHDSAYIKALYRLSDLIQLRQKSPWLWWDYAFKKMSVGKEHDEALKILHSFTKTVIQERMKNKNEDKNIHSRMAFLDVLINAADEDGTKLSLADIQEEVDTFMFEGHDTTSAAMTWAIYLIGRHPDVQRRIEEELDEVFGDDVTNSATMEDLQKLQYLEQVIKESLRMCPSVPLYARTTTEDCEIDGYEVPKGSELTLFAYCIHHNPQVWEDPDRFDPDRFSKENSAGRHPFAYIPFSAGPRNCIGQRFALLEEKVILSQILRKYEIVSHDKYEDVKMTGDLILRPASSLNITLTERVK